MSRRITITLESYNYEAIKAGLAEFGIEMKDISEERLSKMLSHALGYVDFSRETILEELLYETSPFKNKELED